MSRKRVTVVLCSALLVILMSVPAYAQAPVEASSRVTLALRWTNAYDFKVSLSFASGRGTLGASVFGHNGTTRITGVAVLERLNSDGTYSHVKSWTDMSADGDMLLWGTDYYVARGYTYRYTFTATVYKNGFGETVSLSKSVYAS